jgi:hypothetical protein
MAQPGIAADRFAREIVPFLKAVSNARAAAECQTVERRTLMPRAQIESHILLQPLVRSSRTYGRT